MYAAVCSRAIFRLMTTASSALPPLRRREVQPGRPKAGSLHHIPNTTFLVAPISRVGYNEPSAERAGIDYTLHTLKVEDIPHAKVLGKTKGIFKVLIDPETDQILGATLYGAESHELINTVAVAMEGQVTASLLRNHIFTHPSMSESFNDTF